ncbi:MAG: sensor histidine kinase [Lawsonibacter sp.]|jgi:hypothetical protein
MSDLNQSFWESFPEAAVLLDGGRILVSNALARHYLPHLNDQDPIPPYFPPFEGNCQSGTFTHGISTYMFRTAKTSEGLWMFFSPAPQTQLSDVQLDGTLRQLRTLLTQLLGQADAIPSQQRGLFQKSFYQLFRLVDNLDYIRLSSDSNHPAFSPSSMDFVRLCRDVVSEANHLLKNTGITLSFFTPQDTLLLPGDPTLLRRLLVELIANAARAIGTGHIELRLNNPPSRAVLTISDSGSALTARQLAALLQQDSDQYLPTPTSGAGLGLTVARHITSLHQGALLVHWDQASPTLVLSLPVTPLDPHLTVNAPHLQQDGGFSPLLVGLSDILPANLFSFDDLD